MPGEFDFISWLMTQQRPSALVPVPAGDDLAILNFPARDLLLVGVDQVLDGVHFDSAIHPPRLIGAKVMNRNLSDCAAMACLPAAAVVTAALPQAWDHLPPGTPAGLEYAKELYLGMKEAGERFGCEIVGGDTGSWPGKLALSVTILGRSGGMSPITRGGAQPGDHVFVTGPLGGSILGRHLSFVPRINEARKLAATGSITAMIDLSDGLSRDVGHIARQSKVGVILDTASIPIHPDAHTLAARDALDPLQHALHDGEDHELLFTTYRSSIVDPPCFRIGEITGAAGVFIRTPDGAVHPLNARGWEHRVE